MLFARQWLFGVTQAHIWQPRRQIFLFDVVVVVVTKLACNQINGGFYCSRCGFVVRPEREWKPFAGCSRFKYNAIVSASSRKVERFAARRRAGFLCRLL